MSRAAEGWSRVTSAEDWLASPYLDRLVARIAAHHNVPAAELPDLIQETRIALWRAGLEMPVSAALVGSIARNKAIDFVRNLARRRVRRCEAGLLAAARPEVDAELNHLLHLRVAGLPRPLRKFYELHYTQGLSEREIARDWGLCRASVRWLDRKCRRRLLGLRQPEKSLVPSSFKFPRNQVTLEPGSRPAFLSEDLSLRGAARSAARVRAPRAEKPRGVRQRRTEPGG